MSRARDRADGVLHNRTHEDTEGGRESIVTFKGEQSGGEISTLAQIQASHDGTSDDEKADLIFKTNDGSDGASPTERVRVDSAGFVGINESSPSGTLHVKGTSAAHGKVIVEAGGSGGSANNNYLEFNKHDGLKLAEIEVGESVSTGGSLSIKTTPAGGTAATNLHVTHDGEVQMGSQPSFSAYVGSAQTGYDANSVGNSYVVYNTDLYDTGNNHSNGLFTAPVAGVYYFRAEAYTNDYCTQSWFIVNGSRTNASDTAYRSNDTNANFAGNSTILKLAANDTVGFHPYRSGNTNMTVNANANHTWFRGMLIG